MQNSSNFEVSKDFLRILLNSTDFEKSAVLIFTGILNIRERLKKIANTLPENRSNIVLSIYFADVNGWRAVSGGPLRLRLLLRLPLAAGPRPAALERSRRRADPRARVPGSQRGCSSMKRCPLARHGTSQPVKIGGCLKISWC